jgi:hypothetical protein
MDISVDEIHIEVIMKNSQVMFTGYLMVNAEPQEQDKEEIESIINEFKTTRKYNFIEVHNPTDKDKKIVLHDFFYIRNAKTEIPNIMEYYKIYYECSNYHFVDDKNK